MCVCLRVPVSVVACVYVCVCVFSLCPGMPFLHRPHTIQHSTRGPGAVCEWGVSRKESDSTVSNATGADTDRKREKIQRLRDPCLIEGVASCLVRPRK